MSATFQCPVCGFPRLVEQPYSDEGGASYEICECCGFQFGWTDEDQGISFEQWRAKWIADGMPWDTSGGTAAPQGWDPKAQLASLNPIGHLPSG